MASDDSKFAHTALPTDAHSVRLLRFEDTAATELLRFIFGVYKFSDVHVYNTLSYAWGTAQPIEKSSTTAPSSPA